MKKEETQLYICKQLKHASDLFVMPLMRKMMFEMAVVAFSL